ncbi:DUF1269 domain-containing protein [Parafrankia sp. CH37]|uniref:DUF1269 domain-containing protein n=1 Tax=Parafrankia sp. CH37 TaxID=683308 RepID=UPI000AD444E7|nr:DUF1269 domain-containing protein [Parafrankia sp. CH37]
MAELVVLEFDSRQQAEEVWARCQRMSRAGTINLADEALAWRDDDGTVQVRHLTHRTRSAALSGAACGSAVGALFLAPMVGLLVGAGCGAIAGRLLVTEPIDGAMVRRVVGCLQPGRAAVFLLVRRSHPAVVDALREYRPMVIRTSLSPEREGALIRALRGEPTAR